MVRYLNPPDECRSSTEAIPGLKDAPQHSCRVAHGNEQSSMKRFRRKTLRRDNDVDRGHDAPLLYAAVNRPRFVNRDHVDPTANRLARDALLTNDLNGATHLVIFTK